MVENTAAPAPAEAPVTESTDTPPAKVSLKRFCMDLSLTDKRVELIGGFHHTEKASGRLLDTPAAYAFRFADFATAQSK